MHKVKSNGQLILLAEEYGAATLMLLMLLLLGSHENVYRDLKR